MNPETHASIVRSLTQKHLSVSFTFIPPDAQEVTQLSRWLIEVLCLDEGLVTDHQNGGDISENGRLAATFLKCLVSFSRLLLELGRLPVFDQPKVISLEIQSGASGSYGVRVSFPVIDLISSAVYKHVITVAIKLSRWAGQNQITEHTRAIFFETIKQEAVKPLERMIPSGKSTIPVLMAAHSLGIPYMHLGWGVYQLGWGSKSRRMDRSTTDLDTAIGAKLSHNKVAAACLLRMAGLPAPLHLVAYKEADAITAAKRIGFPVVVKPSDLDRGEGVTVDVNDESMLKSAFECAHKLARSKQVIIEQQVEGVCHRLFIANGKLLYAIKRLPMSVKGDGLGNVEQLVKSEIEKQHGMPPWRRTEIEPIDDIALASIQRAGFRLDSVPPDGVLVPLRRIESTIWGGVDEEVSHRIHPENLSLVVRAADLFGLHVAGIDIITPDIAVPWYENGAIINEVNFAPLFGGGEISRRYIPVFLKDFIDGNGRIPVEVFEGDDAVNRARIRKAELTSQGLRCFLTTAALTINAKGMRLSMKSVGLQDRVKALICHRDVDSIIVIASTSSDQK